MIINKPLGHLKISEGGLSEVLSFIENSIAHGEKSYCIPLNLTKYVVAKKDEKLRTAIQGANIVIADGMPIYWFSRRLGYQKTFRITGIELAERIFFAAKEKNWRIFFLGCTSEMLSIAVENVRKKFGLGIGTTIGLRNGYFKNGDIPGLISDLNSFRPDILLLGLGMPQKEYFIADYFKDIEAKFWLPIGGAFDVWAGTKRRSPELLQKAGLEWMYRASYDNKKGKNILKYGANFIKDFLFYHP